MKTTQIVLAAAALLVFAAGSAMATDAIMTINASVLNSAKLTLSAASIAFADADPDTVPIIPSTPATISVDAKSKASSGSTPMLTVLSATELTSGTDIIPVSKVAWTATGAGFVGGTMDLAAVNVGSWAGSGSRTGVLTFGLTNGWYTVGAYSASTTFTLSNP